MTHARAADITFTRDEMEAGMGCPWSKPMVRALWAEARAIYADELDVHPFQIEFTGDTTQLWINGKDAGWVIDSLHRGRIVISQGKQLHQVAGHA